MRITVDEAREYFAHPTQQKASRIDAGSLPTEGMAYYAKDGVCMAFHDAYWPGIAATHIAVKPSAWGNTLQPGLDLIDEFRGDYSPQSIVAHIAASNRACLSLVRRAGFKEVGRLTLPDEEITIQELT